MSTIAGHKPVVPIKGSHLKKTWPHKRQIKLKKTSLKGPSFLTDLGSTNGVLINGEKIRPQTRIPFQAYLSLAFGAVKEALIETVKDKTSATKNPFEAKRQLASSEEKTTKSETNGAKLKPSKFIKKKQEAKGLTPLNILTLLILAGSIAWYVTKENEPAQTEPSEVEQKRNFKKNEDYF